ncbi:hypothetical protein OSTOST_19513 [Ostertagia ostertagi]
MNVSHFRVPQSSAGLGSESKATSQTIRGMNQQPQQKNNNNHAKIEVPSESNRQRPTLRRNHNTNLHIERNQIEEEPTEDDVITSEVHSTEIESSQPRSAKLKAKKAIQEISKRREESTTYLLPILFTHINALMVTMITAIFLAPSVNALPNISCQGNALRVTPPNGTFQLCIRSTCKYFANDSPNLTFQLPATARNEVIAVSMRHFDGDKYTELQENCGLPNVCDVSQTFMSRHLVGNPHCWPTGAIISVGMLLYLIISAIALTVKFMLSREGSPSGTVDTSSDAGKDNKSSQPTAATRRSDQMINIHLQSFRPLPLSRTSVSTAIVMIVCAALLHEVETCQLGFTRHNAEVTCTSQNACAIKFRREILFDEIHNMACVDILHANKSVGVLRIEKLPLELECAKRTQFYTRDTEHRVYSATRCARMGSCKQDACSLIKPDSMIQEFVNASHYPGYTGCEPSCGGFICGCLLPLPSCSFYRIAHVPKTSHIYEIATCMEWKPLIRVKVQLNLHDMAVNKRVTLRPYVTEKVGDTSFTVISLSAPSSPLLKSRFAISEHEGLIVPEADTMPVECKTLKEANDDFHRCQSKVVCQCDADPAPARCYCSHSTISSIRSVISNVLPVSSPFLEVVKRKTSIIAYSRRGEMTLVIESKYMKDSAEYIIKQDCNITLTKLTGCYNCQEGANLIAFCTTATHTWSIIQCETHVFAIECDSSGRENTLLLDFQQAIIKQSCFAECNNRTAHMILEGSLEYLPHMSDEDIFVSHITTWNTTKWFRDWQMIDFGPMLRMIKNHWKASLVTIGAVATFCTPHENGRFALFISALDAANMDEVDVAIHIEPLRDALKELKEQLTMFVMSVDAKMEALVDLVNRHNNVVNQKLDLIMERTKPHSSCVFCSIEDNRDNHPTGRCCRFPDAVSRAIQVTNLRLCNRCLQPKHNEDCGILCTFCGKEHNVLICPGKASLGTSSYKRRKF